MTAQVTDDFSDGNFDAAPAWVGSTNDFIVNSSGQLQLNATAAGKSWMSTDFSVMPRENSIWEFYVKQSFAPSGANFGRVYLMSDQADLSGPLNGYFLQFGEAGSEDAIELFRQAGTALASVCRASAGNIASSFAVRVRVTRDANGAWQLLLAYDATQNFIAEASGTDAVHQSGQFAGVLCTYTITNASRFYYDDFYFSTVEAADTSPPQVLTIDVMTSTSLRINFSEEIDLASGSNPLLFLIDELSMRPQAVANASDMRTMILTFPADFVNGHHLTLKMHGVSDLAGNVMADTAITFRFFQPSPVGFKDIIFTELLPDPSPTVGLPEVEYVELYNRSNNPVDLSGWTLSDGTTTAELIHLILVPGDYVLISNSPEKFEGLKNGMDVSLPSLNNSADIIKLYDPEGAIVDSVAYSESWYTDDTMDGGWSLELIDPLNICAGPRNWTVSESASGGTPGMENSVKASLTDNVGPIVEAVAPSDSITLSIVFNERLEQQIPSSDHFGIEPKRDITSVHFSDAAFSNITIVLQFPLEQGETYRITIRDVYDCSGNVLQGGESSLEFVIPQEAQQSDVIINEILFNPMPQGVDFVEVFNRSEKVINLRDWSLANPQSGDGDNSEKLSSSLSLLYPGEFRVFTKDVDILKGEYIAGYEDTFRQMNLPPLNDDEGAVVLRNESGKLIDSVFYSEDYHNAFVSAAEGISLERVSAFQPANESNWRSASGSSGFATPGYLNSSARSESPADEMVIIEPEVIQPDVVTASFALIRYKLPRAGVVANVRILDQQGRPVRHIASNELLGTEGFFRWDGDMDDGSAAAIGYYLVWLEIFDSEGMVKLVRKRVAIF